MMKTSRLLKISGRYRFQNAVYCRKFAASVTESDTNTVIVSKRGHITCIGINRPEKKNCLDYATAFRLLEAVTDFENDDSALVGIIFGEGGSFCSGYDLHELAKDEEVFKKFEKLKLTDRFVTKPLVAAVSGYALGVGFDLMLWCDLRVIEETAAIGCSGRRFGVPMSDISVQRMQNMLGLSRALNLTLTGRMMRGNECLENGIATRLVACGTGLGQAHSLANSVAKFPQSCLKADRASLYLNAIKSSHSWVDKILKEKQQQRPLAVKDIAVFADKFASLGMGKHGTTKGISMVHKKEEIWE